MFRSMLAAAMLLFTQGNACADQTVSGVLSGTPSWLEGEVITVSGNLFVTGALTIEKNVLVKVAVGANFSVLTGGSINAVGLAGEEIRFTTDDPTPACGSWSGISFLPNAATSSTLEHCIVEYGTAGISVDSVSPVIRNCTIIRICTALSASGTPGGNGSTGTAGSAGVPGGAGGTGTVGGSGTPVNPAYGIHVTGSSSAVIEGTTITQVNGGNGGSGAAGGLGGTGGAGFNGVSPNVPTAGGTGGTGGNGGSGADGGAGYGFSCASTAGVVFHDNTVSQISGGKGGAGARGGTGGTGGQGGNGYFVASGAGINGAVGGGGGGGSVSGAGGDGGLGAGIYVSASGSHSIQGNRVFTIAGAGAGAGGDGSIGGMGGNGGNGGGNNCGAPGTGGAGSAGRFGQAAGLAGVGGYAYGIYIANATLSERIERNQISQIFAAAGGTGGIGGSGGRGGAGGVGGNAGSGCGSELGGTGGTGGNGGTAVSGGAGGVSGKGYGIAGELSSFTAANNYVYSLRGGASAPGGDGGNGGSGGNGGPFGTTSGSPLPTGCGASGGNGQNGASGGSGSVSGESVGLFATGGGASISWYFNTVASLEAGFFTATGGDGGTGGTKGAWGRPAGGCSLPSGGNGGTGLAATQGRPRGLQSIAFASSFARSNVLASFLGAAGLDTGMEAATGGAINSAFNNIYGFDIANSGFAPGAGNTAKDPSFRNVAGGDYHLNSNSLLIDTAAVVAGISTDYDEEPRDSTPDMGADEVMSDLTLTKSDAIDPVVAGTTQTYTLVVSNVMTTSVPDVILTDTLPSGTTFVSSIPGAPDCTESGGVVTCNLGSMSGLSSTTVTIEVQVQSGLTSGTVINNQATVVSSIPENSPANNTASATSTVTLQSDLQVEKIDSADPVAEGNAFGYTIEVTNNGPSDEPSVTVVDQLPAGVSFLSSLPGSPTCTESGGVVTCDLGILEAGTTTQVQIQVQVDTPTVTNQVGVSGEAADLVFGNNADSEDTGVLSTPPGDQTGPVAFPPVDEGDVTSNTLVTFDWAAATDISGVSSYQLQVGTGPGLSDVFDGNVGNVLSAGTSNTTDGQRLWARLRAYDSLGNVSEWTPCSDGITVDVAKPVSHATAGAGSVETTNTVFNVLYIAEDNTSGTQASGILGVQLWFRSGTTGPFTRAGGDTLYSGGHIPFDTAIHGGLGTYQFYTVAVDSTGNEESIQPDTPDLTVVYNGQVPVSISHWTAE